MLFRSTRLSQFGSANTSNNNVAISSCGSVLFSLASASNIVQIGNLQHTAAYVNIPWTITSDTRDKTEIADIALGLDFVNELSPIQYKRCDRETGEILADKLNYGFSAQEVAQIEKKHSDSNVIVDCVDEERLRLTSDYLVPVLVNAIKELTAQVQSLKAEVESLKPNG